MPDSLNQIEIVLYDSLADYLFAADFGVLNNRPQFAVRIMLSELDSREALLESMITQLAQASLSLYPRWYYADEHNAFRRGQTLGFSEVRAVYPQVLATWFQQATHWAQLGQPIRCKGFDRATELAQLALTIQPRSLSITLMPTQSEASTSGILNLRRASELLMAQTHAQVEWAISRNYLNHDYDIPFSTMRVDDLIRSTDTPMDATNDEKVDESVATNQPRRSVHDSLQPNWPASATMHSVLSAIDVDLDADEPIATLSRGLVEGEPHPQSPGEQLLAQSLMGNSTLAGLFEFNQLLPTRMGTRYWVDLLWREGKLVVEIDGYRFHRSVRQFTLDRQRDYELMASGFRILRIPHHEVMTQLDASLQKIHTMVTHCQT